jgi:AcrR family transcriptional regulator
MNTVRKRMTGAERKKQIVMVTLDLVAKHGIQGTTTARIASAAGVSEKTLYKHFASRGELLLGALDVAFDRANHLVFSRQETDALERLRSIGRSHWATVLSDQEGFVYPLYEFAAAPPEAGLRDRLRVRQLASVEALAAIVENGKAQGAISPDVESEQIAWELMAVYMSEDIAYLMGVEEFATGGRSALMLERILRDISTGS